MKSIASFLSLAVFLVVSGLPRGHAIVGPGSARRPTVLARQRRDDVPRPLAGGDQPGHVLGGEVRVGHVTAVKAEEHRMASVAIAGRERQISAHGLLLAVDALEAVTLQGTMAQDSVNAIGESGQKIQLWRARDSPDAERHVPVRNAVRRRRIVGWYDRNRRADQFQCHEPHVLELGPQPDHWLHRAGSLRRADDQISSNAFSYSTSGSSIMSGTITMTINDCPTACVPRTTTTGARCIMAIATSAPCTPSAPRTSPAGSRHSRRT